MCNYNPGRFRCNEDDIGFYKAVVTSEANEELPVLFQLNVTGEAPSIMPEVSGYRRWKSTYIMLIQLDGNQATNPMLCYSSCSAR